MSNEVLDVPEAVQRVLDGFVRTAREALGSDLSAVVLYGSAAEGRLRSTSDVNLLLVLGEFRAERVNALRESSRAAHASIRLEVMFLLEREVGEAVEAFAVKFADVLKRHRVLYGVDPFASIKPSRRAELLRLRQVLLNLALRLRRDYVLASLREEQAALSVAQAAGPLRSAASVLLELRGTAVSSPRAALQEFASELGAPEWSALLEQISEARERRVLRGHDSARVLFGLLSLVEELRRAARALDDAES